MTTIGFSLELDSGAITSLAGLPVVAACRHGEAVVFSDGKRLCRIGGDTDDGAPIAARLTLPATDCGQPGPKRLLGLVLEGRIDGETVVSAASSDGSKLEGVAGPAGSGGLPGRTVARLGRGRGEHWQAEIASRARGAFDLGAVTLVALPLDRRLA
ncbi:hypothetical protein K9F62_08155 [Desulfovibrio sp. JY]|nr:hypothetical protein K9F62_08155 [Desulfovibrio sp. JY]